MRFLTCTATVAFAVMAVDRMVNMLLSALAGWPVLHLNKKQSKNSHRQMKGPIQGEEQCEEYVVTAGPLRVLPL